MSLAYGIKLLVITNTARSGVKRVEIIMWACRHLFVNTLSPLLTLVYHMAYFKST